MATDLIGAWGCLAAVLAALGLVLAAAVSLWRAGTAADRANALQLHDEVGSAGGWR